MSSTCRNTPHTLSSAGLSRPDHLLLRTGAAIVPARDRDEWRRNWRAELWHLHDRQRRLQSIPGISAGLLRDALWLRAEAWRRAYTGTATLCLASLAGLCLLSTLMGIALSDGWLPFRTYLAEHLTRILLSAPLVVAVACATSSRRYVDQHTAEHTTGRTLCWLRRQSFFIAKSILLLTLAFLLSADLCLPLSPVLPLTADLFQVLAFVLCTLSGLMWAFRDQDQRCKHCLCALTHPAPIGRPSHNLLEWTGTRQACPRGHGTFSVPEMLSSWRQSSHWAEVLDLEITTS